MKRKGLEKTPRKPLNDNANGTENGNENEDYKDYKNLKFNNNISRNITSNNNITSNQDLNLNNNAPSGGTLTVPSKSSNNLSSLSSSIISIDTKDTSNSENLETDNTNGSKSSAEILNKAEGTNDTKDSKWASDEELKKEIQGYLSDMAKYALNLIQLDNFEDTFTKAVQCYMQYKRVDKATASEQIDKGFVNFKNEMERSMREQAARGEVQF